MFASRSVLVRPHARIYSLAPNSAGASWLATATRPWMLTVVAGGCGSIAARRQLIRSGPSPRMAASAAADLSFPDWPASFDNTLLRDLRADTFGDPYQSREVHGAHYTRLRPNVKAPKPVLVAHSEEVAATLGMSAADVASEAFLKMFSGSPPATHECWATAYGASFAGSYGGQRGDGRAVSLGQTGEVELQLKGGGTTPFSRQVRTASAPPPHRLRTTSPPPSPHCPCMAAPCMPHPALLQFDGRAVLRSCRRWRHCACPRRAASASWRRATAWCASGTARTGASASSTSRAPSARAWRAATSASGRWNSSPNAATCRCCRRYTYYGHTYYG
eukprot:scaffold55750_cov76-Phaeocystis_antarctica.AAC.2